MLLVFAASSLSLLVFPPYAVTPAIPSVFVSLRKKWDCSGFLNAGALRKKDETKRYSQNVRWSGERGGAVGGRGESLSLFLTPNLERILLVLEVLKNRGKKLCEFRMIGSGEGVSGL